MIDISHSTSSHYVVRAKLYISLGVPEPPPPPNVGFSLAMLGLNVGEAQPNSVGLFGRFVILRSEAYVMGK